MQEKHAGKAIYCTIKVTGGNLSQTLFCQLKHGRGSDLEETMPTVKHQKILPRSNTQLYYNNGGHNNPLKTLRRFHDVDDVTVKDNQ